jgi:DNA transposase THAP9
LKLLNRKILEAKIKGKRVALALTMDEMHVRQHVSWDKCQNKFVGYVNFDSKDETNAVASKALVFMVTAVNGSWKLPVGYFNVAKLNSDNRADLVHACLEFLNRVDADIFSLTFDGDSSCMAAVEAFGVRFDGRDLCSIMINPVNGKPIPVFLDMSHAIKLVRNNFEKCGVITIIKDNEEGVIDWGHIVELERLQSSKGLHLGNRLTPNHINFNNEIMKVKLAAQILSESVAASLDYLRSLNYSFFETSQHTSEFCRYFNYIFDIFNSRTLKSQYFKRPLSAANKDTVFEYMDEVANYIRQLRTSDGQLLITSKMKTGFLGIILNIQSLKALYYRYVIPKI